MATFTEQFVSIYMDFLLHKFLAMWVLDKASASTSKVLIVYLFPLCLDFH